jgi:hypothetical protein
MLEHISNRFEHSGVVTFAPDEEIEEMIGKMTVLAVTGLLMVGMVCSSYAAEGTIKATATWVAEGRFYQVKEKQALFVGAFKGLMFVETKKGDLDAAKIVCPGMIEINLDDGNESGEGRCVITTRNEENVYASWTCAGKFTEGCAGSFTLLGGTGQFEKITGNSEFEIRSDMAQIVASTEGGSVEGSASGIAVWPALTYKTP